MELTQENFKKDFEIFMTMMAAKYGNLLDIHDIFLTVNFGEQNTPDVLCYSRYNNCCVGHQAIYVANILEKLTQTHPEAEKVMRLYLQYKDDEIKLPTRIWSEERGMA